MGREARLVPGKGGRMVAVRPYTDDVREHVLERLAKGDTLTEICLADDMPNRETVQAWMNRDPAFDQAVTRAREIGFAARAERALVDARAATPITAAAARLAFDAERWYLGKLSNAFSDNKPQKVEVDVELSVEARQWFGRADRG